MTRIPSRGALMALLIAGAFWGCASTKVQKEAQSSTVITRDEIMNAGASNLYDVVRRLRPQWLSIKSASSFQLPDEIVVFQGDMQLGGPEALRSIVPGLAYEIQWMDGIRASSVLPGVMSGRHIVGAIIIVTRPPDGG